MKVGLLADIHANAHALKVVLKSAREKNVEKLLCCGDYVGYYYEPDKVMALLDNWDWIGVSGNHEEMLIDWINGKNRRKNKIKYGSGVSIAAEKLEFETARFLYEMPSVMKINIEDKKVILCHGSPWDRDLYIYPDADKKTIKKMANYNSNFDLLIYGHSHYSAIWKQGHKKIINPGSVGQPRDRKPGASWALWDTRTNDISFFREIYDANPVIDMCKKHDPDISYLIDVLVRT